MERYEVYKDSGVDWIGVLPESWAINKLGNLGRYINGYAFKPDQWGDNGLPIIRIQDLTGSNDSPNYFDGEIDAKYLVNPGDLLVSWAATIGVYWWTRQSGWLNQHIFRVIPNEDACCKQFFYWMLNAAIDALDNENKHGIMMEHLTLSVFNAFRVPLPPISDQRAIVDYLDAKTAEIDALVTDCEREVGLLREYRKAVVSEAVTKGLDPDAPMKDSGVEWIGEIPEGWQTVRVKFLAKRLNVGVVINPSTYYDDSGTVPFLKGSNIQGESFDLSDVSMITEESNKHLQKTQVHAGDIVMVRVGDPGRSVVVPPELDGANVASMLKVTCSDAVIPEYLCRIFNSHLCALQVSLFTYGAAMKQINVSDLAEFYIPIPESIEEQEQLIMELNKKTAGIDSLIEAKQQTADKLREYRKSLISEAVTGKFKVPGV